MTAGVLVAVLGGVAVLTVMAWQTVTVDHTTAASAHERFERARARFQGAAPLLVRDAVGKLIPTDRITSGASSSIESLCVLAYHAQSRELVQVTVPFWLWELKASAARGILRDTGFDLETLGMTAADLREVGPALVLDESANSGDWLLAWTE